MRLKGVWYSANYISNSFYTKVLCQRKELKRNFQAEKSDYFND
jgi:hypothetical protein